MFLVIWKSFNTIYKVQETMVKEGNYDTNKRPEILHNYKDDVMVLQDCENEKE